MADLLHGLVAEPSLDHPVFLSDFLCLSLAAGHTLLCLGTSKILYPLSPWSEWDAMMIMMV